MCRAWNHPSYQELERLLPDLRSEQPALAWHLTKTYFGPRRRVLECPRCKGVVPVWLTADTYTHVLSDGRELDYGEMLG